MAAISVDVTGGSVTLGGMMDVDGQLSAFQMSVTV
jgi:hypothetical protein